MILNLKINISWAKIQIVSCFTFAVIHFLQHILHIFLELTNILYFDVICQSIENFRVKVLICVEGKEWPNHTAVNIYLWIRDHNYFKGAKNDEQDVEERTLWILINSFLLIIFVTPVRFGMRLMSLLRVINILPVGKQIHLHVVINIL
jgi:hypothetical protein